MSEKNNKKGQCGGAGVPSAPDVLTTEEALQALEEVRKSEAAKQHAVELLETELKAAQQERDELAKKLEIVARELSALKANNATPPVKDEGEKVVVQCKSKTGGEYRRCGIVFGTQFTKYEVGAHVASRLRLDAHLEVKA